MGPGLGVMLGVGVTLGVGGTLGVGVTDGVGGIDGVGVTLGVGLMVAVGLGVTVGEIVGEGVWPEAEADRKWMDATDGDDQQRKRPGHGETFNCYSAR